MDEREPKIKDAIEMIRPSLQNDGGDIEYIRTEGNIVYVKLQGACAGCMMAAMTLKSGVERMLKQVVDENLEVENISDFE